MTLPPRRRLLVPEYRFIGAHLVLLDAHTRPVVDIMDALTG